MQFFTALLSAFVLAVSTTAARPSHVSQRSELIVVTPHITSPSEGSTWLVNSTQHVTWDTAAIPPSAKNNTGVILIGYLDSQSDSEHLNYSELFE